MGRIIFDQQLAYQVVATTATVIAEDGATATAHGSTGMILLHIFMLLIYQY